jgi:hypothetical protein
MKLRRLMKNCPSRTNLPKGSVVRHSKIGPPMTLWVKTGAGGPDRRSGYFRLALTAHAAGTASATPPKRTPSNPVTGLAHGNKVED